MKGNYHISQFITHIRFSSFPLYISMVTYSMYALIFSAVIKCTKSQDLRVWLSLVFKFIPAVCFIIGIGFAAVLYQLEAVWIIWGIGNGRNIRGNDAFNLSRKWPKPSGPLLPQTYKDVLPHANKTIWFIGWQDIEDATGWK